MIDSITNLEMFSNLFVNKVIVHLSYIYRRNIIACASHVFILSENIYEKLLPTASITDVDDFFFRYRK
jgi:hypothetical protein